MQDRRWSMGAWGVLLGGVLAWPVQAQMQMDQVFLARGTPARGRVTEVARDHVTLEASGGATRQISVPEIVRITFAEEPVDLNAARTAILQRNYNQALAELRKLEGRKIDRDLIRQDAEYYKAFVLCKLAMGEGGDKAAAMEAMLSFVRSAPQSWHFYEAAETLGDLAMSSGKYADAAKYYGPLATAPWPEYQLRGQIAVGRALIGDRQYDEALAKFEAVLASELATAEGLRQKSLAQVGKAVCLAEKGQPDAAIALLQELIQKNDPQDGQLFARIYNALGRCYIKQNKPKDAVLALLHTDLLFYQDPDAHAEALYHLSRLWGELNKSDRALAARSTLRERYAGSVWATLE